MAPSAIVALCLLALVSAAPQNLQDLQCASSCDATQQATVGEVGKTYSFNYNVLSSVKLAGVNGGVTQGGFTGTVDVSRINPCELTIKFTSSNEQDMVNKYPLVVSIIGDGQFGNVCTHPGDNSESINIKKGIVSALQYSLPSFTPTAKQIVQEMSVLGSCPTAYSVQNNGENVVVNKEIVHSECQGHAYSQSEIPSILSKSPMPLQVSKSTCTQTFSSNKVPQSITCKDTKVVRPSYGTYKYIEATQESTLQFTSESIDLSVLSSIKQSQLLSKTLSYDHSMPAKNAALVGKLDTVLTNACEMVKGQGHPDMASVVNNAIELLEHIPDDAFLTTLSKIRAGDYCADYSKLEALYMDAIAFIGEPGALKVIAQEVSAGRVTGGRTALYTAALHLVSKPTVRHVAALTPIAAMEDPSSTLLLAAASVVNKHCKLVSECENIPAVKNILTILTNKLDKQCTPSFSNSNPITVLTTLKAIGNIGFFAPEHLEKVIKCAKTEGVETNVRFATTLAFKNTACKTPVTAVFKSIVLNGAMNTEVRIGSYLAAIKCADEGDLQEIIAKITTDSNKQVQNFVLSHLNNLKESNWPLKAHLKKLLVKLNVPAKYESNIFKYSRNIAMSYNAPILGVGTDVNSNVVYTPESYIPRLVNLGLNMNLLGSFMNIGEVGARVEGLDPIIKEAFGPESYLHKTPLSEMFKDTSLFIKQNGASMFNNLEKLIRQNEAVDIKSLIETVAKFLKTNNIKLPKTDLYAKLMGQEYAFLTLAGPMQQFNINNVIETITSAIIDALVAAKDLNINSARAVHLHFNYAIPTIQGIPLIVKLQSTAVTGIQVISKLDSKSKGHEALLKLIPSVSIAIDGQIGYGAVMKHGLKMKNSIYSTNGLALSVRLSNGQDLEMKLELPEKMELINIKSELYQMTANNNLMNEEKIYPSNIKDERITREHCSAIAEPLTGLHMCFNMNIPDILESNSLPLGEPAMFNVYFKKSDAQLKGYRVIATLKNKADKKVLKMVAGTYGSASSTESSVKLTYAKEANTYQTAVEIKSVWFTTSIKADFINQADLMMLQILANHQFNAGAAKIAACKFDVKKAVIANGNEYQVTGFAGLTKALTEAHKFLTVKALHAKVGEYIKADLLVSVESSVLPLTIGFGLDIPSAAPWFTVIRKVELKAAVGKLVVECLVLKKMPGQYHNSLTIQNAGTNVLLIETTHTLTGEALTNFQFITEASAKFGGKIIDGAFTLKHQNAVVDAEWDLKSAGANIFYINAKHSMASNLYTTLLQIEVPTLSKTMKISNVINVVEFLSYKIMTDMLVDNKALLHIEGPVSLQFSKEMIKNNVDLKISGAFDGTIKFMNAALLSFEKIQYNLDMRHSATPIAMIDIIVDRTNTAETTFKAIVHVPVLIKAEYGAIVTSGLIHTTMNTVILPATAARRFKGYAEMNLIDQKLKADFYWDAAKDTNKKIALTTGLITDSSLGKVLVQGDLTVTTLTYGFKLEAMAASPFKWFLGTSGIELTVTAPTNKVILVQALCTVEQAESRLTFKPLMALHTLNANKYEIAGSFAITKLPAMLNFDISSEWKINAPQIQTITVATKFLHEDKNGACAIVFKIVTTGLIEPMALEITHGASGDKYTTLFKVKKGTTIGSVATNVALISGFKSFDITVDASLPFAVVKSLSIKATKTAEGAIAITFSKNQMVMAKIHYLMTSWTAHTLSFECSSRIFEFFVTFAANEITMKVFPEKNLSSKMLEAIVRVTKKVESAQIECFVTAPSLANEMRIAAEFAFAENTVNVDIHFPTSEFKTLVSATLEELKRVYEDLVKDGVFPDIVVAYKKLYVAFGELPKYLTTLKMQFTMILTKHLSTLKIWAMTMWKTYEAEVMALIKAVYAEVLRYWEILKIEVPILYKDVLVIIKKTEMWKMLNGMVDQIVKSFPVEYNTLLDFYNKVILTAVTEFKELTNKVINIPSFRFETVWKLLQNELPIVLSKLRAQLLSTDIIAVIIKKYADMKTAYPAVYAAITDIWARVIKPVYTDLVTMFWKLMSLNFTNVSQVFEHLLKEMAVFFNNTVTRLLDTEVVRMFITMVKEFIAANPIIKSVYEVAIGVCANIWKALLNGFVMLYEELMQVPQLQKIFEWVQLSTNLNMEFNFKTVTAGVHAFVTEVLGMTYTIDGDRFSAVVTLPVSVSTLSNWWISVTAKLSPIIAEIVNNFNAVIENIPLFITAMKEMVIVYAQFIAEQIPVIVATVKTLVPKYINEMFPVLNNFVEFLMNTEVAKFLVAKINELIKMYPTQVNAIKAYLERSIEFAFKYITLVYTKMMEIPVIRRFVNYIWDLIYQKDIQTTMVSSWNWLSTSVNSLSLTVSSNVPPFIKMHTPSVVSSWITSLIQ